MSPMTSIVPAELAARGLMCRHAIVVGACASRPSADSQNAQNRAHERHP
jgi:hypothetical protein